MGIRQICVARELTKVHQEFVRGTASELSNVFKNARGEFTVVVGPVVSSEKAPKNVDESAVVAVFLAFDRTCWRISTCSDQVGC